MLAPAPLLATPSALNYGGTKLEPFERYSEVFNLQQLLWQPIDLQTMRHCPARSSNTRSTIAGGGINALWKD